MKLTIKTQENIYFLLEWEEWKGQLDQKQFQYIILSTIIPKQNIIFNFVLQKTSLCSPTTNEILPIQKPP